MSYEVITANKREIEILENIMKKKIPQELLEDCE